MALIHLCMCTSGHSEFQYEFRHSELVYKFRHTGYTSSNTRNSNLSHNNNITYICKARNVSIQAKFKAPISLQLTIKIRRRYYQTFRDEVSN